MQLVHLLAGSVIAAAALVPVAGGTTSCTGALSWGYCNNGSSVVIEAQQTRPGTAPPKGGGSGSRAPQPNRSGPQAPPADPPPPTEAQRLDRCVSEWQDSIRCFHARSNDDPVDEPDSTDTAPSLLPITLTDIASFAPASIDVIAEPDGLGLVGAPTNLVASASARTQAGELFGRPVSVRFTPTAYVFQHGDGTSSRHSTGGSTWAALGQAPFTAAPTSHVYRDRGEYVVRADVEYRADVDLGSGWTPVSGILSISGIPQSVRIFEAHTALVQHTCAETPRSPGC